MKRAFAIGVAAVALLGIAATATYSYLSPQPALGQIADAAKDNDPEPLHPAPVAPRPPAPMSAEKLKRLPSMSTADMTSDPEVRPVLMALTGAHWPQFEQAMAHGVARELDGTVFAYACTDKACSGDEAALAVETVSGKAYAMLLRRGVGGNGRAEMRWFGGAKLVELPLPLLHFAAMNGLDVPPALVERAATFIKRSALGR